MNELMDELLEAYPDTDGLEDEEKAVLKKKAFDNAKQYVCNYFRSSLSNYVINVQYMFCISIFILLFNHSLSCCKMSNISIAINQVLPICSNNIFLHEVICASWFITYYLYFCHTELPKSHRG